MRTVIVLVAALAVLAVADESRLAEHLDSFVSGEKEFTDSDVDTLGSMSEKTAACAYVKTVYNSVKREYSSAVDFQKEAKRTHVLCSRPGVLSARIGAIRKELTSTDEELKTLKEISQFVSKKAVLSDSEKELVESTLSSHGVLGEAAEKLRKGHHSRIQGLIQRLIKELSSRKTTLTKQVKELTKARSNCKNSQSALNCAGEQVKITKRELSRISAILRHVGGSYLCTGKLWTNCRMRSVTNGRYTCQRQYCKHASGKYQYRGKFLKCKCRKTWWNCKWHSVNRGFKKCQRKRCQHCSGRWAWHNSYRNCKCRKTWFNCRYQKVNNGRHTCLRLRCQHCNGKWHYRGNHKSCKCRATWFNCKWHGYRRVNRQRICRRLRCQHCNGSWHWRQHGHCKNQYVMHGRIALRGGRGNRWCADEGHRVICNRPWIRSWERFLVSWRGGDRIALRGGRGNRWCADEGHRIICNRPWIRSWETYTAVHVGGSRVALRGGRHNRYCADEGSTVRCNRTWIRGWERFLWRRV